MLSVQLDVLFHNNLFSNTFDIEWAKKLFKIVEKLKFFINKSLEASFVIKTQNKLSLDFSSCQFNSRTSCTHSRCQNVHCFYNIRQLNLEKNLTSVSCMCVVVTFILIVNSDIVLGRIAAQFYLKRLCAYNPDHNIYWEREEEKKSSSSDWKRKNRIKSNKIDFQSNKNHLFTLQMWKLCGMWFNTCGINLEKLELHKNCCAWKVRVWIKMATQKPGEWASCILSRFEEQVMRKTHWFP